MVGDFGLVSGNTNPNPKVRKSGAVGKAVLASMVLKSAGRWDHRALRWTGACYWHGVGGFVFNAHAQRA